MLKTYKQIVPIILSGGSGTRLWPLSRKKYPKQYLPLLSDNSMLQETIIRLRGLNNVTDPVIVCNADHRFLVAEQCKEVGITNPSIILEHVGRNSAPAITAAALYISTKYDDSSLLLVLAADHVITDIKSFHEAIKLAILEAQKEKLVTFGIVPTNANTGYGYIKLSKSEEKGVNHVEKFVEKPDLKTAITYLEEGNYLWNSGMFMFKANILLSEIKTYSSDIFRYVSDAFNKSTEDFDFLRLNENAFESSPSNSIDYALMEKSDKVVVVGLEAGWCDIGSWSALQDFGSKDQNNNVIKGDVISIDTNNSFVYSEHHLVATLGVKDLVIVDTPNAVLVSTKKRSHQVDEIVNQLRYKNREEQESHRKVYRPWGWYDVIESGEFFQVKRLNVKPGARLSLQMHQKRAEHWVVVTGEALVTKGNEEFILTQGQSIHIPIGEIHSLQNLTKNELEIIEVQSGTYLGEDDIKRFKDDYGRD
jgi:mannose-1-phosphate guanylyltransferase / mannose-6-phosphate isomerase